MKLKNLLLVYNSENQLIFTLDKNLLTFNQVNSLVDNNYYIINSNNLLVDL